jgi:hypothetical protein
MTVSTVPVAGLALHRDGIGVDLVDAAHNDVNRSTQSLPPIYTFLDYIDPD